MEKHTVYIVPFEHIDECQNVGDPHEIARLVTERRLPCTLEIAEPAFRKAGWEGDGKIVVFWIPPFMFDDYDTDGVYIWHVKQSNNGTSWLCADKPYPFPALANRSAGWKAVEIE